MKKIIPIIALLFLISSCGIQKSDFKLKKYKTKKFAVNYPNTWVKFGSANYNYFMPLALRKKNPQDELNHLSVNHHRVFVKQSDGIENTLIGFSENSFEWQKNKVNIISKINNDSKFIYKIESVFETNVDENKYKKVEYFYTTSNSNYLEYISFSMREDLFDKYINEAMIIINSFETK